jgi:hypothetical protein
LDCTRVSQGAPKEDFMAFVMLFAGLSVCCMVLWYCAVYALPVFVGCSMGWWALNHGAGAGCVATGLFAGVTVFLLGRLAVGSRKFWLRRVALAAFVTPAAYTGFSIVCDLAPSSAPVWKYLLAVGAAVVIGGVTYGRLTWENTQTTLVTRDSNSIVA